MKGSARSYGEIDLIPLFEHIREDCVNIGGHAGAGGLTVESARFMEITGKIQKYGKENFPVPANEEQTEWDFEMSAEELPKFLEEQQQYAPFGEGIPKPVICVKGYKKAYRMTKIGQADHMMLGSSGKHVKLFNEYCDAIGFDLAEEYAKHAEEETHDLIGSVGYNAFNGSITPQFQIKGFI